MNLSPEWYRFHLELALEMIQGALPNFQAAAAAVNAVFLESLSHREKNPFGSPAVKRAHLHDIEADRQESRKELQMAIRGMREDIRAIEAEISSLARKSQHEENHALAAAPAKPVGNENALEGQKEA